jgi:hypothetical protein
LVSIVFRAAIARLPERFLSDTLRIGQLDREEKSGQCGDKDDLMRYDSRERLLSGEARHRFVPPDLAAIGPELEPV